MARRGGAVHVVTTRRHYKDKVYETVLLRRSYREGGKVKTETLANLSHLPPRGDRCGAGQPGRTDAGGRRPRSPRTWASPRPRPTTSTPPWTGCCLARAASRHPSSPAGTSAPVAGCSTTCRAPGWKAAAALSPSGATHVTAR